jgi:NAD(P)-dependent dehydrogenase (short-subunit alcohol dehydrogenase family)
MDLLWDVNVKGTLFCAQAASRDMHARGSGAIVNLASQAALLSLPNQVVYTATKGAICALTRSLAIDWAPHGVRVNAIAPTFVWTPMAAPMLAIEQVHAAVIKRIPLGRVGRPQDIAGAALFLCSDAASLITGHTLPVDGGWTAGEPGLDL